ncbi:hypothetical protein CDAR_116221, partial [Caerostris darwini]
MLVSEMFIRITSRVMEQDSSLLTLTEKILSFGAFEAKCR